MYFFARANTVPVRTSARIALPLPIPSSRADARDSNSSQPGRDERDQVRHESLGGQPLGDEEAFDGRRLSDDRQPIVKGVTSGLRAGARKAPG